MVIGVLNEMGGCMLVGVCCGVSSEINLSTTTGHPGTSMGPFSFTNVVGSCTGILGGGAIVVGCSRIKDVSQHLPSWGCGCMGPFIILGEAVLGGVQVTIVSGIVTPVASLSNRSATDRGPGSGIR